MSAGLDAIASGDLTDLVERGLRTAQVVFGIDGARAPGTALAASAVERADRAHGPTVVALLTNDRSSLEVVFGALLTGRRLVSVPLPSRGGDLTGYADLLRSACATFGVEGVTCSTATGSLLESIGVPVDQEAPRPAGAGPLGPFELVQYSSGSTARPKAIRVTGSALLANISSILARVEPRPGDVTVTWLPLSHDLGLVGMVLSSIVASACLVGPGDLVILRPEDFLRQPSLWMLAVSRWRGTFTAAPDFAYRLAADHAARTPDLQLASLRCAIVGGEIVRRDTLAAFEQAFRPAGLSETALCPAYGLAEVGLAVSMVSPSTRWSAMEVPVAALDDGVPLEPCADRTLSIVSAGPPLDGYQIRSGSDGAGVAPIFVRGPSTGCDGITGAGFAGHDGWLPTGDRGFQASGELHIVGRADDQLVVRGRNLHAPALEQVVATVDGVRSGRVGIAASPTGDWLVAVEPSRREDGDDRDGALVQRIVAAVVREVAARPSEVIVLGPGSLPMTPSGKLQRAELTRRWIAGELVDARSAEEAP